MEKITEILGDALGQVENAKMQQTQHAIEELLDEISFIEAGAKLCDINVLARSIGRFAIYSTDIMKNFGNESSDKIVNKDMLNAFNEIGNYIATNGIADDAAELFNINCTCSIK